MRYRTPLLLLLFWSAAMSGLRSQVTGQSTGAHAAVPMCKASDLSLATDAENGSFDGMSHSGILLVLRNLGPVACAVPQRPEIRFLDGSKPDEQPLPIKLDIPGAKFMHPGPVLVPAVVAPGAEVTAKLRWVSGEVYDSSVCLAPAAIAVTVRGQAAACRAGCTHLWRSHEGCDV